MQYQYSAMQYKAIELSIHAMSKNRTYTLDINALNNVCSSVFYRIDHSSMGSDFNVTDFLCELYIKWLHGLVG